MKDNISILIKKNKVYFIIVLCSLIWLFFIDEYNWVKLISDSGKLKQVKSETTFYSKKLEVDKEKLKQLKKDTLELEKFAREEYFLKKPNEDVYLLIDD